LPYTKRKGSLEFLATWCAPPHKVRLDGSNSEWVRFLNYGGNKKRKEKKKKKRNYHYQRSLHGLKKWDWALF